ncbi:hypothetical protein HNP84_006513 [Thermocatellispora tengchongensis]|uniref:Uncharacterized protein n=1 Tax=Thermocatellispora tengchongensis TaxID=1073253 RepID=A0A840PBY5_9ACTN|nr:hypothetical protein [Thermocatellispora tengchongensis]MBB5136762.1 hypothetical protein [Thermocatellispora tengchongensis]
MREDEVRAAANAIIPHLPVLVGKEAATTEAELRDALARGGDGTPVKAELLRILARRAETRDWARRLLEVPERVRAFEPLPGAARHIRIPRYACPQGDGEPWFRFDVRDPVPTCPVHGLDFVRVG